MQIWQAKEGNQAKPYVLRGESRNVNALDK